jgi:hypothetical protein
MCSFVKRLIIIFSLPTILYSITVKDSFMGYQIDLPQNWKDTVINSTTHEFFDTSGTYTAVVGIVMNDFTLETEYKTSLQWTRAHFLAYLITVRSTISSLGVPLSDPYGSIIFYDSSTSEQSGLKSMELYAEFSSLLDSSQPWDEYIKYTAVKKKGYEIYVLGIDTADMAKNLNYYVDFVSSIKIDTVTASVIFQPVIKNAKNQTTSFMTDENGTYVQYDLMGRNVFRNTVHFNRQVASGLILMKNYRYMNMLH